MFGRHGERPPRNPRNTLLISLAVVALSAFIFLVVYVAGGAGFRDNQLWELMGLIIIPTVTGSVAWLFNRRADRYKAIERERQTILATYYDQMSELLLKYRLRSSEEGDEASVIALAHTLSTLRNLDGERKGQVLRFLFESRLISENPVIALQGADLKGADLKGARLEGANLERANLEGANLERANLERANLEGAHLRGAWLKGAHLWLANLEWANLREANLERANLREANLEEANLWRAHLEGAELEGANLKEASLRRANLEGAELEGANLEWADVTPSQLASARSLKNATMPDGTKYEEWIARGKPAWIQVTEELQIVYEPEENGSESEDED